MTEAEEKKYPRIYLQAGATLINGAGEKVAYLPGSSFCPDSFSDADFRVEIDGVLYDTYYDVEDGDHHGHLFTRACYIREKGRSHESGNYHRAIPIQPVVIEAKK